MRPAAPVLFSTMTGRSRPARMCSASSRASASPLPPAAKGTTTRTACSPLCERASSESSAAPGRVASRRTMNVLRSISPMLSPSLSASGYRAAPVAQTLSSEPEMLGPAGRPRVTPALLAAVDGQDFPGNEFARRRCQIDRGLRHIPNVTWPPHWVGFRIGFPALGWIVREAGRLEHTRCNAVDANAERRPLHGYALRQVSDTSTGGRRVGDARHTAPKVGNNVDDCARCLALDPALGRGLHHVPGAIEVIVNDGCPTLGFEVERGLRELPTGIVDEDVEATTMLPDVGDVLRAALVVSDIEGLGIDGCAKALEEDFGFGQAFLVASENGKIGAEASKQRGDREAKAAAGTGNDGDLAFEEVGSIDRRHGAKLLVAQAVVRCAFQGHGFALSSHVDGGGFTIASSQCVAHVPSGHFEACALVTCLFAWSLVPLASSARAPALTRPFMPCAGSRLEFGVCRAGSWQRAPPPSHRRDRHARA